MDNVCD